MNIELLKQANYISEEKGMSIRSAIRFTNRKPEPKFTGPNITKPKNKRKK